MDDRELEARLRRRLRQRFDGPEPPASLRPTTADVAADRPRALPRSVSLAWLAAATLIVAIVAGIGLRGGVGPGGTATHRASPTPTVYAPQVIVMPPAGSNPSKASTTMATDILGLRLRAIGATTFSSGGGYAITFTVPATLDAGLVTSVLSANGVLSFVPLPPADYATNRAVVGEPLPVAEPALFGRDQIASAGVATTNGVPSSIHFDLRPPAADALGTWSGSHVGETLAILVDGKVAALPQIRAPITGGRLEIGTVGNRPPWFLAAIVTSGTLPEGWLNPVIPTVIPEADARGRALAWVATAGVMVESASLSTFGEPGVGAGPVAAWYVTFTHDVPLLDLATNQVVLDALTGAVLSPAP